MTEAKVREVFRCLVIAGMTFMISVTSNASAEDIAEIPQCSSKQAIEAIKDTIENGALSNLVKTELLDYDNLDEILFNEELGLRRCIADVVLNTGNETIFYEFTRAKSDPSRMMVKVKKLNFGEAHGLRSVIGGRKTKKHQEEKSAVEVPSAEAGMSQMNLEEKVNLCLDVANKDEMRKNETLIVTACKQASEEGNARAQNALGYYYSGRNAEESVKWYQKAAEQGLVTAMFNLGNGYAHSMQWKKAYFWLYVAAESGDEEAKSNLKAVGSQYAAAVLAVTETDERKLLGDERKKGDAWLSKLQNK